MSISSCLLGNIAAVTHVNVVRVSRVNIVIHFGSTREIMYTVLHSFPCASLSVILGVDNLFL